MASRNQEFIIFDLMQPPHAEDEKGAWRSKARERTPETEIDSQTVNKDLSGIDLRIVFANVIAIEFRNCDAEFAAFELAIEVVASDEEVRTVQCHAESCTEHPGGHHPSPCTEVTMMNVDVFDALIPQRRRKTSAKKCVNESSKVLGEWFGTAKGAPQEIGNQSELFQ